MATVHELLPVGSVVRLQGASALIMVMGFAPQVGDMEADYLGVAYPQGLVSEHAALAFDADAVDEVVWRGHWDEEGNEALAAVRRLRAVGADSYRRLKELADSMTPERYAELCADYAFRAMGEDDEPELVGEDEHSENELTEEEQWQLEEDFGLLEDEPEPDFPDE